MSADFWAGYISGAVGILIGNPLDLIKVRLQADRPSPVPRPSPSPTSPLFPANASSTTALRGYFPTFTSLITGTAAPILGYGALNALLFVSYNRSEAFLNSYFPSSTSSPDSPTTGSNLYTTFLAGTIGGLATWAVSTPTELIKCRAQVQTHTPALSSLAIARQVLRTEGVRGLYFGGTVTAIRDSVGYGFYFWSYELSRRWMGRYGGNETADVLLCGGLAGIVTWASIFPLDVIKTRVQTQVLTPESAPLLGADGLEVKAKRLGAWQVARETYREGGAKVFFRGLGVCSVRAFIVNAVQWAVYEWIMTELGQGRDRRKPETQLAMDVS
ncbi:mitochondrial carrier [Coniochaeta ligniaria NRRL 30616]|uniref:Mitochondrial carrier n=1 Tax=Coniochaeta ligniaria NRRL 30616 TaxID=1408157 RepID=A0A1J7IF90_9PEZI|nr:mitochondrial carrier [Coniochaeta ligniaria NRRL 30616]